MAKVFVGNFSFNVDESKLTEYFAPVAQVSSIKIMKDAQTGRSRGFAFLEFSSDDDAKRIVDAFDGKVWDGRIVKVSLDNKGATKKAPGQRGEYSHDRGERPERNNENRENRYAKSESSEGDSNNSSEDRQSSYNSNNNQPLTYFRAQPLDLGIRKKKKKDMFDENPDLLIDYKDVKLLSRFTSERGRVLPRRTTGLTSHHQRLVSKAIKRAQQIALIPYSK